MGSSVNFHDEFHRIQQALQKRLFKKVDYSGSATELLDLGNTLRREGNAPYAALCCTAVAQCHRATEMPLKAAHYESEAGQLLWNEELDLAQLDKSAFHEFVSEATNCYLCAITIYLQHGRFGLASTLYAEMASHLLALGQAGDAGIYYEKAAQLIEQQAPHVAAGMIQQSVLCRVASQDYSGAIEALSWLLPVLQHRPSKSLGNRAADSELGRNAVAECLLGQALLRGLLREYKEAEELLAALQKHAAQIETRMTSTTVPNGVVEIFDRSATDGNPTQSLPSSDIHTVVLPILAAFLEACQAKNREEAVLLQEELTEMVAPLHNDLLLLCLPEL